MNAKRAYFLILTVESILLFIIFFWMEITSAAERKVVRVVTSIPPHAYVAERIGGKFVHADVLIDEGKSPHSWEPTPTRVAKLSQADVFFTLNLPEERILLGKIKKLHGTLRYVDLQRGVNFRCLDRGIDVEKKELACVIDPHTWLSPKNMAIQAGIICDTLVSMYGEHTDYFRRNLKAFLADLEEVNSMVTHILAPFKGKKIYVFHPAFGYFTDTYGLFQVPIQAEGKEPGPRTLSIIVHQAKREGVKVIFIQPQFSVKNAQAIARAIGGEVFSINPLSKNYIANLEIMARTIAKGLGT
ncbi:MAG: zinc ABC transporter substrate-binding protein [Syntrophales bacterium]|nr:zinc ABC transporter substrate-binding protein [Syntrophales bacterium]